jgi:hypothetical protein
MPEEIIGEVIGGLIETTSIVATSSDISDDKKGCGCLVLIFVIAIITVITYCVIKY